MLNKNDPLDRFIIGFDSALRTLFVTAHALRPTPGEDTPEAEMSAAEKRHAAALMRVNHCGEICAQALYQGQALTAKNPAVQKTLMQAAQEETDHLAWTAQRVSELGGRTSLLNPVWYAGSMVMGAVAGALGDKWNLGFLAETEKQVEAHLHGHLQCLPAADAKSHAVVAQMKTDEAGHAHTAVMQGAAELPEAVKRAMQLGSRVMTKTAYWV